MRAPVTGMSPFAAAGVTTLDRALAAQAASATTRQIQRGVVMAAHMLCATAPTFEPRRTLAAHVPRCKSLRSAQHSARRFMSCLPTFGGDSYDVGLLTRGDLRGGHRALGWL